MKVSIRRGSLTDGSELVLVNASNTNAQLGTGVSAAIRHACGPGYQEKISAQLLAQRGGPMQPGDVLMTDAGTHPRAKWVAHVAVMDYREGFSGSSFPTAWTIRTGLERLWDSVEALPAPGPLSVALVALGGGTGQLGVREPTKIACETLKAHLAIHTQSRLEHVVFYGYQTHEYLAMAEVLLEFFPDVVDSLSAEDKDFILRARATP